MTDSNNGKIAMVLTKKKKKTTTKSALKDEFGADTNTQQHQAPPPERTSPLVIPLTQPTTGPLDKLKQEDAAAAQALMDSAAAHHYETLQNTNNKGDTNFSANGNLFIPVAQTHVVVSRKPKQQQQQHEETDAQQLQRDLQTRAPDVTVDSSVYTNIPIAEFGAALLRGMGWKGNDTTTTNKEENSVCMPRPHRLGLGATPTLPELTSARNNGGKMMKRPDQVQREERLKQQHEEYQAKRDEQIRLDKQKTLQIGSIVRIDAKRAKMVQLLGVPGLNQVLVQYEGRDTTTFVKKGSVVLVSRDELEKCPYREAKPKQESFKVKREQENGRKRIKREEDDDESDKQHHGRRDADDNRQRRPDYNRSRDDSSSKLRNDHHRETKKRRTDESEHAAVEHWLIPNIRVRVVTKKLSSRQYKQKGLVLDVTHGGAYATLQMSDGQILDRVPERYLETALPKVGGNAIILTGKHGLEKGKLLERNSDSGQGVVQVFEDMNVVQLSLDDMAEWCGPLDDDLEL